MTNRKNLYGYRIENGVLAVCPDEEPVVERVATLYLAGASYQAIADTLNKEGIPFSQEAPLWNKHKVKRLLENPRYTGSDGYPPILDRGLHSERKASRTPIQRLPTLSMRRRAPAARRHEPAKGYAVPQMHHLRHPDHHSGQ